RAHKQENQPFRSPPFSEQLLRVNVSDRTQAPEAHCCQEFRRFSLQSLAGNQKAANEISGQRTKTNSEAARSQSRQQRAAVGRNQYQQRIWRRLLEGL